MLSKEVSSTIFKSLVWLDLELNPCLPNLWRTLYPLDQWAGTYIYIVIHRQICFVLSELISVAGIETLVDSNAKPKLLTIQPRGDITCEVNFKRLWITVTIVYIHPFNGCRDFSSYTKRLAMNADGNTITSSPKNSTLRG